MTLTEKWKKGELENDWYYILTTNGIEKWEYIKQSHGFGYYETEWVLEVLASVPSYKEWQELKLHDEKATIKLGEKIIENQQLKELLKAANKFLKDYGFSFDGKDCAKAFKVHTEINEVLKCR